MHRQPDVAGTRAMAEHSPPPLSLYIHFPWCVRKCPYCDFNSHAIKGDLPEHDYLEALLRDLELDLPRVWGRRVQSIFMGGGTPSLFSGGAIDRLLGEIRARVPLAPDAEITLEANPGAAEYSRFREYRSAGINRLSIGVQSFDDHALGSLGRIHNASEARRAIDKAVSAGFDNFNIDLMFGLPDQQTEAAIRDVKAAMAFEPAHLSIYQLTLEPNTPFHARPPQLPDEHTLEEMTDALAQLTASAGYRHYEVSAYARGAMECRHNRNYWEFGDYLGIGAGAHGKISDPVRGIFRTAKRRQPQEYLRHAGTELAWTSPPESVSPENLAFEFMLNALRLVDGVPMELFAERTGLGIEHCQAGLDVARSRGLLAIDPHVLQTTPLGRRFLNDLVALFLPPSGTI